jgi:hypothetical protein
VVWGTLDEGVTTYCYEFEFVSLSRRKPQFGIVNTSVGVLGCGEETC